MSGSDLDRFMLACSDLKQPARSKLFPTRPGLKDIKVQARAPASSSFQTSQKARDWSCLDLGDAFSQPTAPQPQSAACDDDDFDDFQSCPPPPSAAPPPLSGLATPLSSVPGLQGGFVGFNAAPRPFPAVNGTGGHAGTDMSQQSHTNPQNSVADGNVAQLNGLGSGQREMSSHSSGSMFGVSHAADLSGAALDTHGPTVNGGAVSGSGSVSPTSQKFPAGCVQQPGGVPADSFVSPAASWAASSPAFPVQSSPAWSADHQPQAPPPAAGFTPIQPNASAAKPTRFREGLVQRRSESSEDDFADFVTAAPAPAPAAAVRQEQAGQFSNSSGSALDWKPACRFGGRLPTVDDSPPPHAPAPPSDIYAALRDLSQPAVETPVSSDLMAGESPALRTSGSEPTASDWSGLAVSSSSAVVSGISPSSLLPLSNPSAGSSLPPPLVPALNPVLPPSVGTAAALTESGFSANNIEDEEDEFGDFIAAPVASESMPPPPLLSMPAPAAVPAAASLPVITSIDDQSGGGPSIASSRRGSLLSLDLQVPSAEAGEVSPLEMDRRDQAAGAPDGQPASQPVEPDTAKNDVPRTGDKYDVFRQDVDQFVFGQSGDKYDSFRKELVSAPASEPRLTAEWRRCLQACYELLQEGVTLFGSVSSSRVCSEVVASKQGVNYISNLTRVHGVMGRIEVACERHGCRRQLDFILSETAKVWANLTSFIANSPARASPVLPRPSETSTDAVGCGVCLLSLGTDSEQEPTLSCAGRRYHSACANLWTNRVSSVLPALTA